MANILALQETLHETKMRDRIVALKLDFDKAYDKVHRGFLLKCLRARGFNEKLCSKIESVLHNGTVDVKVNDCVGPYFQSYKGVRQGGHVSPPVI
jgi:hypothetical protein